MSDWYEADVLANGIRLHYYRTGGKLPQVVLCHGFTDDGLCWSTLARQLKTDYDVIMLDARCHGQSEAPRSGNSVCAMADDLVEFVGRLRLNHPVALGHSMGAGYVFEAAARYPDVLRAIALEDPVWRDEPAGVTLTEEERRRRAEARRADIARIWGTPVEERLAQVRAEHPAWDPESLERWVESTYRMSPTIFETGSLQFTPWRETLAQVQCPVLVFTGDPALGAIVTDEIMAEADCIHPHVERVHVPGVGHHIRFARHDVYTPAFQGYLARIYAAGRGFYR